MYELILQSAKFKGQYFEERVYVPVICFKYPYLLAILNYQDICVTSKQPIIYML